MTDPLVTSAADGTRVVSVRRRSVVRVMLGDIWRVFSDPEVVSAVIVISSVISFSGLLFGYIDQSTLYWTTGLVAGTPLVTLVVLNAITMIRKWYLSALHRAEEPPRPNFIGGRDGPKIRRKKPW